MAVSIHKISDEELITSLDNSVKKESQCTFDILLQLAEMDRRRLGASLGYSSLYDYAVRRLGYSPGSAQRRIKAARAIKFVPEVYDCLKDGTLSLGVLEVISEALRSDNAVTLIRAVHGLSRQEALKVVAEYYPVHTNKQYDEVRPVMAHKFTSLRAEASKIVENELEYRVSFTATEELKAKLDRAKELVYSKGGDVSLESVLSRALDEYLSKHCPKKRHERREKQREVRERRKNERIIRAADQVRDAANEIARKLPEVDPARLRDVPQRLKDEVLARDGYCCTFVARDGTKCECRVDLEADHIQPFAHGGRTELGNLRTVCRGGIIREHPRC